MRTWSAKNSWGRFTGCFVYDFVFQVINEKKLCSKDIARNLENILLADWMVAGRILAKFSKLTEI